MKPDQLNSISTIQTIYNNITHGIQNGVLHLTARNESYNGKTTVFEKGKEVLNFSSYSYLGLDQHPILKQACIEAADKYGTQFGFSRAFISIDLYEELENLLGKVFDAEVVVAPSTTLAHQAVLPVMITDKDAVIIDQQAHASMQYSVKSLRDKGVTVELVRHNRIDLIEEKVIKLRKKHQKVWYMCDSVYSMYGDYAPLKELEELMNRYEQFYLYVDDAHGMSWSGKFGRGYALNQIPLHNNMIVVSSLNKAYAGAGGVIAVSKANSEWKKKIRTCGGTLIFSTPIQPPMLGVDVASASFHLTNELVDLQEQLAQRIIHCRKKIEQLGVPEISQNDSPIFYVPTSFPKVSYNLTKRMMDEGYYLAPTLFPAVSMRKAGLRFSINVNNSMQETDQMLQALQHHYPLAVAEESIAQETIFKFFGIANPLKKEKKLPIAEPLQQLRLEKYTSITKIDKQEWDKWLGDNGGFDWNGMSFLEKTFKGNAKKENNWDFYYYLVKDQNGACVLATFFTKCWCKDDMFKAALISKEIELVRRTDPYYLCTETLMMGSLMTEGNHLYLDKNSKYWQEAVLLMLNDVHDEQLKTGVNAIQLRDFECGDTDLTDMFTANGFVKMELVDFSHELELKDWNTPAEFLKGIVNKKKRNQVKMSMLNYEDKYEVSVKDCVSEKQLMHYYQLYKNVKKNSLLLNTFDLPFSVFEEMNKNEHWEMIVLHLKKEEYLKGAAQEAVGVVFCYKTEKNYIPLYMGLDYTYLYSHKNYKQSMYQIVKRAKKLNCEKIYLGVTASTEKKRLGARSISKNVFLQLQDSYNMDVLQLKSKQLISVG